MHKIIKLALICIAIYLSGFMNTSLASAACGQYTGVNYVEHLPSSGCSQTCPTGQSCFQKHYHHVMCDGGYQFSAAEVPGCMENGAVKDYQYYGAENIEKNRTAAVINPQKIAACSGNCNASGCNGVSKNGVNAPNNTCGKQASCSLTNGKPVSNSSGNMYLTHTDFTIQTGGIPFTFSRTYNSLYDPWREGPHSIVGFGWHHSFEGRISVGNLSSAKPGFRHHRVRIGTSIFAFEHNAVNGYYPPVRGSGGYTLQKTTSEWILTSPDGMIHHFDTTTKMLTKQINRHDHYLKYEYTDALNTLNHYRLRSIKSYLPPINGNETPLPKALFFQYKNVSGYYRLHKVVAGSSTQDTTQCSTSTCANSGGVCINTIEDSTSHGSIIACGKPMLELQHNSDADQTPATYPVIGTGLELPCVWVADKCAMRSPVPLALLKAHRGIKGQTNNVIHYTSSPGNFWAGFPQITKVKDGTDATLESHTYDSTTLKALTSVGPDGEFTFTYKYNGDPNKTRITRPNGQTQIKTFDPDLARLTATSGSCSCSMGGESFGWTAQHGYILPTYVKIRDTTPTRWKTYQHGWNGSKMAWQKVITGDDDSNGATTPGHSNYTTNTTYFHPTYPGLPIALVTDSQNSGQKREIIFDYDDPNAAHCNTPSTCTVCEAGTTCTAGQFNQAPTPILRRMITRGYTKTIAGGNTWQLVTKIVNYTYDSLGRLTQTSGPEVNQQTTMSYYDGAEVLQNHHHQLYQIKQTVVDPRGGTSTQYLTSTFSSYNDFGVPTQIQDSNDLIHKVVYDDYGNIKELHKDQRKLSSDPPDWAIWKFTRDAAGRVLIEETPTGGRTHYSYDPYGRLDTTSFQDGPNGTILPLQKYIYNTSGQLKEVQQLQSKDNSSQVIKLTKAYSFVNNKMTVDTTPAVPGQGSTKHVYNQDKTLAEVTDQNGHRTVFEYHAERRWLTKITKYTDPANTNAIYITMTYDNNGKMLTKTDPRGVTTSYVYDDFGQVIELTSPDRAPSGSSLHFEFDKNGNMTKKKRPDGSIVTYMYDTLNRLVRIDYPAPPTGANGSLTDNDINYYYGESTHTSFAKGHLTRVTVKMLKLSGTQDLVKTTRYIYDASGRIIEEQTDNGGTVYKTKYQYNKDNQRTLVQYPYTTWRQYQTDYNTAGQLTALSLVVSGLGTHVRFKAGYQDSAGNAAAGGGLGTMTHDYQYVSGTPTPTGMETLSRELNAGAIAGISTTGGHKSWQASGPAIDINLTGHAGILSRELIHNKTGIIDAIGCLTGTGCFPGNQSKSYKYDGLYRMTEGGESVNNAPRYAFQYDANGNVTNQNDKTLNGDEWALQYTAGTNRLNRRYLAGNPAPQQPNYLQYTDGKRKEDPYWTYTYHMNGRLAVMEPKAGNNKGKVVFGYDHAGRRVYKIVFDPQNSANSTTSMFFFDLGGLLLEQYDQPSNDPNAHKIQHWAWAGARLIGGGVHQVVDASTSITKTYNYHLDHMGRPVAVTSRDGYPVWRSKSTPYGAEQGYALKDNPFQQTDITSNSIKRLNYGASENSSQTQDLMTTGTYAIQFYFKTLKFEFGYDSLIVSSQDSTGATPLQMFTGDYQTGAWGNTATGFWGPVLRVKPKEISSSNLGQILFQVQSDGSVQLAGYEITKYRLWHIPDGNTITKSVNDSPAVGGASYADNLGQGSTPPWQRDYTNAGAKMSRACFANLHLEYRFDRVEIRDAGHNIIQIITGSYSGCSNWVQGDTVRVLLFSDSSAQGSGFTIDKIEHLQSPEIKARFPGQWYEKDTEVLDSGGDLLYVGLHYNWRRFYDPNVGRYITPDPLGLRGGSNPYLYALGNPVNITDPTGLFPPALIIYGYFIRQVVLSLAFEYLMQRVLHHFIGCGKFRLNIGAMIISGSLGGAFSINRAITLSRHYMRAKRAKMAAMADDAAKARKSTGCFVKGTLVQTKDGKKKIENIQVGEVVLTPRVRPKQKQPKTKAKKAPPKKRLRQENKR